jgi:hypothetical protein
MMNKIFLCFISFVLIGCGKTPDWKIYHQTSGETILIDDSSIKKKGDYVSFWYVSDLKSYPNLHFLWKVVYNCKTQMSMSLYYDVVESISTLPKNIPDLTDEDRWLKITDDRWDRNVFDKLCGDRVKKTFF